MRNLIAYNLDLDLAVLRQVEGRSDLHTQEAVSLNILLDNKNIFCITLQHNALKDLPYIQSKDSVIFYYAFI